MPIESDERCFGGAPRPLTYDTNSVRQNSFRAPIALKQDGRGRGGCDISVVIYRHDKSSKRGVFVNDRCCWSAGHPLPATLTSALEAVCKQRKLAQALVFVVEVMRKLPLFLVQTPTAPSMHHVSQSCAVLWVCSFFLNVVAHGILGTRLDVC